MIFALFFAPLGFLSASLEADDAELPRRSSTYTIPDLGPPPMPPLEGPEPTQP
jgi:hypothetical protein